MQKLYFWSITLLLLFIICYGLLAFHLQRSITTEYKATQLKIDEYNSWGLTIDDFKTLIQEVYPYTTNKKILTLPFTYNNNRKKLHNIGLLVNQQYATESIKYSDELLQKIGYVRDRIVKSDILSETITVDFLQQIQSVSGTVFESKPTLLTIQRAIHSIDAIDANISVQMEHIRKNSILTEVQNYKERCMNDEIFFIQRRSIEGRRISQICKSHIDTILNTENQSSNSAQLTKYVEQNIYNRVVESEKLKNQIYQNELFAELEKRKEHERLTLVPPPAVSTGKVIVINLGIQRLYAYENGKSIFTTAVPITSGKNGFETVTGEYAIYYKQQNFRMTSPFPGIYYDNVVQYWMPFYLGYGIHDASWRTVYGTQDYLSVGSHGCVNTPLSEVAVLYNWAEIGTKVIVY